MRRVWLWMAGPIGVCLCLVGCTGSSHGSNADSATPLSPVAPSPPASPAPPPSSWDLDRLGVPKFITHNYIDLAAISQVSRFRSGEGHDYSDSVESCRSMKHYFFTPHGAEAASVPIYAPVTGDIVVSYEEWAGMQIAIRPTGYPFFAVVLFHVNPTVTVAVGTHLEAGTQIGTHIGNQTMSDVAVSVGATEGYRLVSWFDAITDEVFAEFQARGLGSREDAIISRAERDANPLSCNGEAFAGRGSIENWVSLR